MITLIVLQKFASDCDDDIKIVKLKTVDKLQVVDMHNFFRDKVASGDQSFFPVTMCVQEKIRIL